MTRQIKTIYAILFGLNALSAIIGIIIGARIETICLGAISAMWIAICYRQQKDYAELMDSCVRLYKVHVKATARHLKTLDIIKEGLTTEWQSPEEFEKWKEEKTKELFKDEND